MNRTIGILSANYNFSCLGTLTEKRPAACVPFGGRYRAMDFALSNMVNARISTVGLITPYYYRSLLDHVGAGKEWGLDRKQGGLFILPGTVFGFRDTGSRFLFRDITHNDSFLDSGDGDYVLVSSGSLIYNADYQRLIERHELGGQAITFLYRKMQPGEQRRGYYLTLDGQGNVTAINPGVQGENLFLDCYIINKTTLQRLMRDFKALGHMDFLNIVGENLAEIRAGAVGFEGYVGFTATPQDYMRSSMELLDPSVRQELFHGERQICTKIHDTPPAAYLPGSQTHNSVLAAGSIIGGRVERSVVFRNVRVKAGATVKSSVLMEGCVVHPGAQLEYVICDKNVTVSSGVSLRGTPENPCILPKGAAI